MSQPHDADSLRLLGTEQVRPELDALDELSVEDLVELMCHDVRRVPDALARARDQIAAAVHGVVRQLERGGRLVYVGAGTAGRLGMLDAAEAGPTFNVEPGQVVGILAGGLNAFGVPLEGAEDDVAGGASAVRDLGVDERDCVVGISASGRTPYVLGAMAAARESGALSVGLSCNVDTPLSAAVDLPIEVVVGPELIAGSTRMNSGTAQKLVLNIISTASMVRLGKTYGNLMVDVRPTNEKLRDRSQRIVARITGASDERVAAALAAGQWRPKVAATMILGDLSEPDASRLLAQYAGRLRPVLDTLRRDGSSPRTTSTWRRLGVAAAFVDGALVTGDVALRGDEVVAVGLSGPGSGLAIPGFVDTQVNGYGGVDLLHADVDAVLEMGEALRRDGVVAYQPTLITSDVDQLRSAVRSIDEARTRTTSGARILGIHLEGPFLSPRRAGTHPLEHLRLPDVELMGTLLATGRVATVTVAPELPGALELIAYCVSRGVTVWLGHTATSADNARRGFDAGASAVTHLFNAMEPMSARSPGLAGVALTRPDVTVQFIADGVHVADEMMRLAITAARGRWVIVSDAIAAAGVDRDVVQLGDVTVTVTNGVARRDDGTLAGSVGPLRDALVRVGSLGVDLADALGAVVTRPARLAGAHDLPSLRPGDPANLVILDERLAVTRHVRAGDVLDVG
jgi:N-acetylmuramic acid 6-phosphate etherase/N-acetylglucosamine-6-phosphate deacetylase